MIQVQPHGALGFLAAIQWLEFAPTLPPLAFGLVYVVASVLLVPGSLLALAAGFLFGVVKGSLLVSMASTVGATCSFLVGRYWARSWVLEKVKSSRRLESLDSMIAQAGWRMVATSRVTPFLPCNLVNYAFGLSAVSLREYVAASWVGMLPGTVLYVYMGSLAKSLSQLAASDQQMSPWIWIYQVFGLIVSSWLFWYVAKLAKKTWPSTSELSVENEGQNLAISKVRSEQNA